MAIVAVAAIACVAVLQRNLNQRIAAQLMRQRPCFGLVDMHERRVDDVAFHAFVNGLLQRVQRIAATIGIARIIGLAHAADQHAQSAPISQRRAIGEEQRLRQAQRLMADFPSFLFRHRR